MRETNNDIQDGGAAGKEILICGLLIAASILVCSLFSILVAACGVLLTFGKSVEALSGGTPKACGHEDVDRSEGEAKLSGALSVESTREREVERAQMVNSIQRKQPN
jgi:hypothetical protein